MVKYLPPSKTEEALFRWRWWFVGDVRPKSQNDQPLFIINHFWEGPLRDTDVKEKEIEQSVIIRPRTKILYESVVWCLCPADRDIKRISVTTESEGKRVNHLFLKNFSRILLLKKSLFIQKKERKNKVFKWTGAQS